MTSLLSKSIRALRLAAAATLLPVLASSCQWMSEDYDDGIADSSAAQYINVTVSVSASTDHVTRAYPDGGETGDGLEKGQERENAVSNITLIFYQATDGINTTGEETVLYVKNYDVHPVGAADLPGSYTHNHTTGGWSGETDANEVIYSTGDRRLDETELQAGQSYRVLVVANAVPPVRKGDKISDVREKVQNIIYTGTGVGVNATDFVMASERDATIALTNPVVNASENRFTYYFECIHIERLAARIDFSTHYPTSNAVYDADTYTKPGYVYKVWKNTDTTEPTSNDRFVVTNVTPFNLTNGANEYFVKRVSEGSNYTARVVTPVFLGYETTDNWVLDCYSNASKNATIGYAPRFLAVNTLDALKTQTAVSASVKRVELNGTWHSNTENYITTDGYDNIIVGYATENTIDDDSPLYYYATGLAIEGLYIHDGVETPRVVYTFLRHQGEGYATGQSSYDAFKLEGETAAETTELINVAKSMKSKAGTAMNFGVVRNNIYRVSIDKITEEENVLIKVKNWDVYMHDPIYM